ncbi:brassinosteroid-responsive RING protein 1-like [Magnolia sinica]|uniref:brassinosteroid-responsive RING protein 1-like n=1 Tax=Magnolia sinica TaxID=86752 RepID=UPI00265AC9A6|nr:brassinosteroid-responsive RING protein 1-like [Magnolia sinica]
MQTHISPLYRHKIQEERLPLAMGFVVAFPHLGLPRFLLHAYYVLGFLRDLIFCLFRLLCLSHLVESYVPVSSDASDCIQRPRFQSASAMLIRQILPVVSFEDLCMEKVMDRCLICLSEFEGGEEIRRLMNCKHLFHRSCLDRWMDCNHQTCPLCRSHLVPEDMREEFEERVLEADAALYSDGEDPFMLQEFGLSWVVDNPIQPISQ